MSWVVALLLFGGVCALWSFSRNGGRAKESTPKLRGGSFAPIQSLTDDERQYEYSAALQECTCPDFSERRHEFPKDDARRLCKHLVQVLGKEGWPEAFRHERTVLQACRNRKRGFPVYGRRGVFNVNKATYQIFWSQHETEWVDVYERDRWGYNTSERRWAYNDKPRHAGQLACHLLGLEPFQPDNISTVSLVQDGDEYHWIALGDLDGVRLTARINTRASWQQISVDGDTFCACHPAEKTWMESDLYPNMIDAVCVWVGRMAEEAKQLRQQAKQPTPKAKPAKLSTAELQAKNTARKREVRAQQPTEEVEAALEKLRVLLADALPNGVTLEGLDRTKHYTVTLNGNPRQWICRLHYKTGNKYIEVRGQKPTPTDDLTAIEPFTGTIRSIIDEHTH